MNHGPGRSGESIQVLEPGSGVNLEAEKRRADQRQRDQFDRLPAMKAELAAIALSGLIKILGERSDFSPEQLADAARHFHPFPTEPTNEAIIQSLEKEPNISLNIVLVMAIALGITPEELFGPSESHDPSA